MIVNGVEIADINIFKVSTAQVLDEAIERVISVADQTKDGKLHEVAGAQVNAVRAFFDAVYGAGTAQQVFGDEDDMLVHLRAFAQVCDAVNAQKQGLSDELQRFKPNRAARRAKGK